MVISFINNVHLYAERIYINRLFLGKYVCKECGHDLFRSETKYKHHTPWPAFSNTILSDSVAKKEERKGTLKVKNIHKDVFMCFHFMFLLIYVVCVWPTKGTYVCSACNNPLFSSSSKYEHGTPWPAFHNPITTNSLAKRKEGARAYKVRVIF